MPIIYMRHPIHGSKVATMEAEAEYDERNGWEAYDPLQLQDEPVNSLVPVRRGRPRKESVNGDSRRAD